LLTASRSQFNSMLSAVRRANRNGVYDIQTNQMHYPAIMQPTHARIEQIVDGDEPEQQPAGSSTIFPAIKPSISRNFLVMDMHLETPPAGVSVAAYDVPFRTSRADYESSAAADFLAPFKDLRSVSDDIRDLLPEECRQAFDSAKEKENGWFDRWGNEADVTSRREPVVDKAIVPYSMMIA
jgi:chromatin structure-remodeling complex protein RSC7